MNRKRTRRKRRNKRKQAQQRKEQAHVGLLARIAIQDLPPADTAPTKRVVIYIRVSSRQQARNICGQFYFLYMRCLAMGYEVVGVIVDKSSVTEQPVGDRFREALALANNHGAAVVARSTFRCTRSSNFKTDPYAPLTDQDVEDFNRIVGDSLVYVVLPKELSPKQEAKEESKQGQPFQKATALQRRILTYAAQGNSINGIAKLANKSNTMVRRVLREFDFPFRQHDCWTRLQD